MIKKSMNTYLRKMKGGGKTPKLTPLSNIFWSFVGAFFRNCRPALQPL